MTVPPKVFICHASEDKARFVIPFAIELRKKGVDAWVDQFEIHSGDSIVRKIFDQGIENAKAVIAVISSASISKPWVQAEIDVAFVRRIEGKCKLIPVVLEGAKVPNALSALRWETVSDVHNFEAALHNVLLSIFDQYEKPPLGTSPQFVTTQVANIPDLTRIDASVLLGCCKASEKADSLFMDGPVLIGVANDAGITTDALCESLEVLSQKRLLDIDKIDNGDITGFNLTVSGYDTYLRACDNDYAGHFRQIIARVANNGDVSGDQLISATNLSPRTVYHFIQILSLKGHLTFIDMSQYGCAKFKITTVSAALRRLLE